MAHVDLDLDSLPVSPLIHLPVEILIEVFLLVKSWHAYSDGCLYLAHICHHWREVALDTPLLWQTILVYCTAERPANPDFLAEILRRSQDAPLRVSLALSAVRRDILDPLSEHVGRMEMLLCNEFDPDFHTHEARLTPYGDAKWLRTLKAFAPNSASPHGPEHSIPFVSPNSPLKELLSLTLHRYSYNHAAQFFRPTLTCLQLHGCYHGHLHQILQALLEMPALKELSLQALLHNDVPHLTHNLPIVELPLLKQLYLSNNLADLSALLLDHLLFPSFIDLSIGVHDEDPFSSGSLKLGAALLSKAAGNLVSGAVSTVHTMLIRCIENDYDDPVTVYMWPDPSQHPPEDQIIFSPPSISNSSYSYSVVSSGQSRGAIEQLCRAAPHRLLHIQNLFMNDSDDDRDEYFDRMRPRVFWHDSLRSFTGLVRLYLRDLFWDGLGTATSSTHGAHTSTLLPFPQLRLLSLSYVSFRDTEPLHGYRSNDRVDLVISLHDALTVRRQSGLKLSTLAIFKAVNFRQEDVDTLRSLVEQIHWDSAVNEADWNGDFH